MNIYLLPTSDFALKNKIFEPRGLSERGGISNADSWHNFYVACKERGVEAYTYDFWSRDKSRPDDILLVQNHPGETWLWRFFYFLRNPTSRGGFILARRRFLLENYKFFGRRVLLQLESPMVTPYVYRNLDSLKKDGIYNKIFLICRGFGKEYGYFNYYQIQTRPIISPYFREKKDKFLVMINANIPPHSLKNELYSARLTAIKYFSEVSGFDLYGYDWDKMPRSPLLFHYGKYVRRVWRGITADKLKTLSEYKFAMCFENASYSGYVTEKIFDCLAAGTIPIYLGAPDIESIVPPSCFIDFRRFSAKGGSPPDGRAGASGGKNYAELYEFLKSLRPEDLESYRNSELTFLSDKSKLKGPGDFINELLLRDSPKPKIRPAGLP
jgi:hypothetical protein